MLLVVPWHVGSSQTKDQTCVPCIARWILIQSATREVHALLNYQGMRVTFENCTCSPWKHICVCVCARTCGLVARLSPKGALSLLFAGSSTGSPPSHRMGFERNKDSFLSSIRVSKGGLRMIIHFLKTTCAARVPLTLPLCSDLAPAVCSSRRAPSLHTWCPSASAPSSLGSALGRLGSGPPSPLRVAVSCSCAGAPGTACLGL